MGNKSQAGRASLNPKATFSLKMSCWQETSPDYHCHIDKKNMRWIWEQRIMRSTMLKLGEVAWRLQLKRLNWGQIFVRILFEHLWHGFSHTPINIAWSMLNTNVQPGYFPSPSKSSRFSGTICHRSQGWKIGHHMPKHFSRNLTGWFIPCDFVMIISRLHQHPGWHVLHHAFPFIVIC